MSINEKENKHTLGLAYEQLAAKHLTGEDYHILQSNYRCKYGEIDLIAEHEGYLVFIEVKYRAGSQLGNPEEAVTSGKQKKICRAATWYRMCHSIPEDRPVRFDVVAICGEEIRVIPNAFEYWV